jgi:hypothetical protein
MKEDNPRINNKMITSKFVGTKVVPKDLVFPEIGELSGDFGKEVLAEYNGLVEKDYGNLPALRVLKYSNGIVKGSNPFATVLLNSILPNGLRTATQADLERAMQVGIPFAGTYEDTGLVLRTENGANEYLAKNLMAQFKAINKKVKMPKMINLNDLQLERGANSPHGLAFKLIEGANPIYAPILNQRGQFSSEDVNLETGLPKKLGNGNRTLYSRQEQEGLSRLYLYNDSDLYSYNVDLASSGENGRVRVFKIAEGKQ